MNDTVMTVKDWIQLIVPIVSNFFISGIVLVFITKAIEGHFSSKERKRIYVHQLLTDIAVQLNTCYTRSIKIQYGKPGEEMAQNILSLNDAIVDLNEYLKVNTDFIHKYENKHKMSFLLPSFVDMVKRMNNIGYIVNDKHIVEYSEISEDLDSIYKIITEMLNKYNSMLAKI